MFASAVKRPTFSMPIAETGLRGPVSVPQNESGCAALRAELGARLIAAREKFDDLAAQRAGTDRIASK